MVLAGRNELVVGEKEVGDRGARGARGARGVRGIWFPTNKVK